MTYHVVYNHQCPECAAFYIPYDEDVPCPKCGRVESERFDYISEAAASMQINKQSRNSYTPPAWWVGSLGDHILHILFSLFDASEKDEGGQDFGEFAAEYLSRMEWGDQEYLSDHIRGIAVRVRSELDRG